MRTILVVGLGLVLAGCVEVTRFKDPAGDVYLADCETDLRLQSCSAALDSTCPQGYDLIQPAMRRDGAKMVPSKSPYFRCR